MRFIETFTFIALLNSALCLATAFVLGVVIGAERQYRQRSAGLGRCTRRLEGGKPVGEWD